MEVLDNQVCLSCLEFGNMGVKPTIPEYSIIIKYDLNHQLFSSVMV